MSRKMIWGTLVAAGVLVVTGFVTHQNTQRLAQVNEHLAQTHVLREELHRLIGDLRRASAAKRLYLLTGAAEDADAFHASTRTVEERISRLTALTEIRERQHGRVILLERDTNEVLDQMRRAVALREQDELGAALETLASGDRGQIDSLVQEMMYEEDRLIVEHAETVQGVIDGSLAILAGGITMAALIMVLVLRYIDRELRHRSSAETALAEAKANLENELEQRTGQLEETNARLQAELESRRQTDAELQQSNEELQGWVTALERRNHESSVLNEMGDMLQTCQRAEEAYEVIAMCAQRLFPDFSGAVYVTSPSRNVVEAFAAWGDQQRSANKVFAPEECWALRRGRVHTVSKPRSAIVCDHMGSDHSVPYACVPMVAQGEALGILHLRSHNSDALLEATERLAVTVAEHIALALANLRLRESLSNLAVRDPLTSLFNRRYMEESLDREVRRAARNDTPVSVAMLDLDHFKEFNDTFGHAAGDTLLRELGAYLKSQIRGEDIACRYGGEELTLVMPDALMENAVQRLDQIREGVKHLTVQHRGQPLGQITVSVGVATYPLNAATTDGLLRAADQALYRAKELGRDHVVAAEGMETDDSAAGRRGETSMAAEFGEEPGEKP